MASLQRRIPADITAEQRQRVRTLAVDAFRYLDLAGVTRVDFLMDAATGQIWINEVNTIPGSLAFYLWAPVGVGYPELLDRLIGLALKRQRQAEDITYAFDTNILAGARLGGKGGKG
jgi:D-alanine-D-alanine ligase